MKPFFLVGLGGFSGALLRYYVGGWAQTVLAHIGFPFGTLTVNLLGCFILGFLGGFSENFGISQEIRLFVMVGLLGSFTTFSTFSYDTLTLLRDQAILYAALNVGIQVMIGLLAAWLGFLLAHQL